MTRTTVFGISIGILMSGLAATYFATKTSACPIGVDGAIVALDDVGQRIQVIDSDNDYWFSCTPTTRITLNGLAATFNQLAIGQSVKVEYDAYTYEATQVDAMPPIRR